MLRLLLLGFAVFAFGCAKEEEEDELSPPSSLFSSEDLEQGSSRMLDNDGIVYELTNSDTFAASLVQDDVGTCISNGIDNAKVQADKLNLTVDAKVDLSACSFGEGVTLTGGELKFRVWFGCPDADLEGLDGKTVADLEDVEIECGSHMDHQMLTNMSLELGMSMPYELEDGSTATLISNSISRSAMQTASGKPCEVNHSGTTYTVSDKCEQVEKYTQTSSFEGSSSQGSTEDYNKASFRGLTLEDSGEASWYSSGTMDVIFNNWTGTVAFSGPSTPPTYTMTDGTTTLEGTIGAGSNLQDSLSRTITSRVQRAMQEARASMQLQAQSL